MNITLETDYAIRIVDCLARSGVRMSAQSIAEKNGVTLRFSLKILSKLAASGIMRSYKGALGGYELARPSEEITLNDIFETIEGPYTLSRCLRDGYTCQRNGEGKCPYHNIFGDISLMVRERLKNVTIADMAGGETPASL